MNSSFIGRNNYLSFRRKFVHDMRETFLYIYKRFYHNIYIEVIPRIPRKKENHFFQYSPVVS